MICALCKTVLTSLDTWVEVLVAGRLAACHRDCAERYAPLDEWRPSQGRAGS